jgi:hypothetical protein
MKPSEAIAISILESLLPGVSARYRQDQSTSTHDIDLEYPDGRIVPVEVTISVEEELKRTLAALSDKTKGSHFVSRAECKQDWYVVLDERRALRIKRIRQQVDGYLAAIEAEGLDRFNAPSDAWRSPSVRRIWDDLGIAEGHPVNWDPPGWIVIAPPGESARIHGSSVEQAVLKEAAKADNLDKLRSVDSPERHLFVYIDPSNFPVLMALVEREVPQGVPSLPPEITHVWAAGEAGSGERYIVWRATSSSPWECAGVVKIGPAADVLESRDRER